MKHRLSQWCMGVLLSLVAVTAFAAEPVVAGKDYQVLKHPQPTAADSVEVREFFSYACPHCFTFEPKFADWVRQAPKGVKVVRVPVVFHESWKPYAKAYIVAETLGVLDKIHRPLFDALHVKNQKIRTDADLIAFFAAQGVPKDQAAREFASFNTDRLLRQAAQTQAAYRIDGTPTVVIAGKYVVSPSRTGGHDRMTQVIDTLVRQELAAKK